MILLVSDKFPGFYKGSVCTPYTLITISIIINFIEQRDGKALLPTLLHVLPMYPSEQRQVLLSTQAPFSHGGLHTTVDRNFKINFHSKYAKTYLEPTIQLVLQSLHFL